MFGREQGSPFALWLKWRPENKQEQEGGTRRTRLSVRGIMDGRGFNVARDTVISRGPTVITAIESVSFGGKGARYQRYKSGHKATLSYSY